MKVKVFRVEENYDIVLFFGLFGRYFEVTGYRGQSVFSSIISGQGWGSWILVEGQMYKLERNGGILCIVISLVWRELYDFGFSSGLLDSRINFCLSVNYLWVRTGFRSRQG